MKALLQQLQIGNSVAEYDEQLEKYFLQTQIFSDFTDGRYDIVRGDKGTGKTAIFRIAQRQKRHLPALDAVLLAPAFNQSGSPVFQQFNDIKRPTERDLIKVWKAYIFAVVGNKLVDNEEFLGDTPTLSIKKVLEDAGLRERSDNFSGLLLRAFKVLDIKLKLNLGILRMSIGGRNKRASPQDQVNRIGERGLERVQEGCQQANKRVWILFDRLDEAFVGQPDLELPCSASPVPYIS